MMNCCTEDRSGVARIVRGNDFTLRLHVKRAVLGSDGKTAQEDMDLTGCTDIAVSRVDWQGRKTAMDYSRDGGSVLLVPFDETVPSGAYGMEVTGKDADGNDWRFYAEAGELLQIVEPTSAAYIPEGDSVQGYYDVSVAVAAVSLPTELVERMEATQHDVEDSEKARVAAEEDRNNAELKRTESEKLRGLFEDDRKLGEKDRITAEKARVTAEQARVEAEQKREQMVADLNATSFTLGKASAVYNNGKEEQDVLAKVGVSDSECTAGMVTMYGPSLNPGVSVDGTFNVAGLHQFANRNYLRLTPEANSAPEGYKFSLETDGNDAKTAQTCSVPTTFTEVLHGKHPTVDVANLYNSDVIPTVGWIATAIGWLLDDVATEDQIQEYVQNNAQPKGDYVTYESNTVTVAGNSKAIAKLTPEAAYFPQGIVMGGTAAAAGLVTRGITGVSTPDSNGGCTKENLYVNYDGGTDNTYSHKLVLGAGSAGADITAKTGASKVPASNMGKTYCAVRGDEMVNYVTAKVGEVSTKLDGKASAEDVTALQEDMTINYAKKTDIPDTADMVRATSDSEHVLLGDGSVISMEDLMVKIGTRDVVTPVSYEEVK